MVGSHVHEEPEDEIDPEVDVDEKLEEVPRPVGVHVETDAIGAAREYGEEDDNLRDVPGHSERLPGCTTQREVLGDCFARSTIQSKRAELSPAPRITRSQPADGRDGRDGIERGLILGGSCGRWGGEGRIRGSGVTDHVNE